MGALEQRRDRVLFLVLRQDFGSECFCIVKGVAKIAARVDANR